MNGMSGKTNYILWHYEALSAIYQRYGSEEFEPADVADILKKSKENKCFLGTAARHHGMFFQEYKNKNSATRRYKMKMDTQEKILQLGGKTEQ